MESECAKLYARPCSSWNGKKAKPKQRKYDVKPSTRKMVRDNVNYVHGKSEFYKINRAKSKKPTTSAVF